MKTMKSWLATTTVCGALALVPACQPASMSGGKPVEAAPAAPVEIGSTLYAAVAMPSLPASTPVGEPIVIPNAVVQNDLRMQVPASVDGIVDMVAVLVPKGTAINPNDSDILYHPRDAERLQPYRRLRAGDVVRKGEVMARLDEQLVYLQVMLLQNTGRSIDDLLVSELAAETAQLKVLEATNSVPGVSQLEKQDKEANYHRYRVSRLGKVQEKVKNDGDLKSAERLIAATSAWRRSTAASSESSSSPASSPRPARRFSKSSRAIAFASKVSSTPASRRRCGAA